MTDPAFTGAGSRVGLELFRIENFTCVKIPTVNGKFYSGDSYILLATASPEDKSRPRFSIHFWLGSQSTQDERGVASYKAAELDEMLGGSPVQYREVEGSESPLFLSYFKTTGGIEYMNGGVESGFHHVVRDVYQTRLLHLKGKRTVRIKEVPLSTASLNKGDVFILDEGLKLYIFNGSSANVYEKAKGIEVASAIDSERGGRASIIRLEDDMTAGAFWGPLGGYVDPATLPAGEPDDDTPAQKIVARLFKIGSAGGGLTDVAPYPFSKEMLTSDMVCMLHSSSGRVYIWVGTHAPLDVKRNSMFIASQYVKLNNFPSSTVIERVGEGVETASFKGEFARWSPPLSFGLKTMKTGTVRQEDMTVDVNQLLAAKAKEETPVDNGQGSVQVWLITDFKKVPVDPSKYGQFYGGDSYIVLYSYEVSGARRHIIYFWLGTTSSADEKGAAAYLAAEMDREMGGAPVQVRVTQGKEPAHFRALFKGRVIVHAEGKASSFKTVSQDWSTDGTEGAAGLYHVKGTTEVNTMGTQVRLHCSSLNSEDAFVLVAPQTVYVWEGNGCIPEETTVASNIATILAQDYKGSGGRQVVRVKEGAEPEAFWTLVGGKGEYARTSPGEQHPKAARLFQASTATGTFRVEEVLDFEQTDLSEDDVFLTDIYTSLFVWVGAKSTDEERKKSFEVAEKFVNEANDGRSRRIPIVRMTSGTEPAFFTSQFRTWDDKWAEKSQFKDVYQARLERLAAEQAARAGATPAPTPLAALHHVEPTPPATPLSVTTPISLRPVDEAASPRPSLIQPSSPAFANVALKSTGRQVLVEDLPKPPSAPSTPSVRPLKHVATPDAAPAPAAPATSAPEYAHVALKHSPGATPETPADAPAFAKVALRSSIGGTPPPSADPDAKGPAYAKVALRSSTGPAAVKADGPPAFAKVALRSSGIGTSDSSWRVAEDKSGATTAAGGGTPAYANLALKKTGATTPGPAASSSTTTPSYAGVSLKSTGGGVTTPAASPAPTTSSLPSTYNAQAIHAYEVLRTSAPADIDPANKERHMNVAEFMFVFGMNIAAFNAMPKWKRDAKKKDVGLF